MYNWVFIIESKVWKIGLLIPKILITHWWFVWMECKQRIRLNCTKQSKLLSSISTFVGQT